ATREPIGPEALAPLFPKEIIRQEVSQNPREPIPEELREAYLRLGRPTPLFRATRLEKFLKTPARVYYKREDRNPVGGRKLNHVLMHQTVIGQETLLQLRSIDETPDVMVGSVGGGSNFAGFTYPAIGERLKGKLDTRFVAVEPETIPSLTQGKYEYDFGDTAEMTPLMKMYTLGHAFMPPAIHAGGLRYHGAAPSVSLLLNQGIIEARAFDQLSTFEAGALFARTEGIVPAPETCHAIKGAIELALEAKRRNE